MLLVAQPRSVGILSSHTVHGVLRLGGCPAVYLERGGDPLERVALDPVVGGGMGRWDTPPTLLLSGGSSSLRSPLFWHLLPTDATLESDRANGHLSQGCCPLEPGTPRALEHHFFSLRWCWRGVQPWTGDRAGHNGAKVLPFLLQHSKVLFEGWADLVEQLYKGMAEEAGAGRLGVEVVGCGPAGREVTEQVPSIYPSA